MPRRLLVITNADAGSAAERSVEEALTVLRERAHVEVAATSGVEELDGLLDKRDGRYLVVAGGDGSLHAVVAALHRRGELADAVLGLIPLGTGNDRARSLGLPLQPAAAARVVLTGEPLQLELLEDDAGGVVVNAVHVGVGAEAARRALSWKPRLGKPAYALGAALAGTTRGWRLRVEADGEVISDIDERLLMVGVGLGSSIGGGTPLAPDARPDDSVAEVVVSRATGPLARVGYALQLRRGTHGERTDVRTVQARTVSVSGQPFPVNADGELSGPVSARTWTLRPRAWRLLAPPQAPDRGAPRA